MTPPQNRITGYILEEPTIFDHGWFIHERPTFFLRVHYPQKKEGWTRYPDEVRRVSDKSRKFPFILHPSIAKKVMANGPWTGQFVDVTYYIETFEKFGEIRVLLYAVNIEPLLSDFPQAKSKIDGLWLDTNSIEQEVEDAEL